MIVISEAIDYEILDGISGQIFLRYMNILIDVESHVLVVTC